MGWSEQDERQEQEILDRIAAIMRPARNHILRLLEQLSVADDLARDQNQNPAPSLWQRQNALLRLEAKHALDALGDDSGGSR